FPARPRLADHALARWHVAAGEEHVLLHDTKAGRTVRLGAREWGLLAAADGIGEVEASAEHDDDGARPVEALSGFSLRCDGRGSCCRLYASIVFSLAE